MMDQTAPLTSLWQGIREDWGWANFNSYLLIGLASLLYIFHVQIHHALGTQHIILRQVGVALPLLFMVVNVGESYLSVHATSLFFAAFSSFLYQDT